MANDPKAEPQYGERVPFVIAYDSSSQRLVDCARCPEEFLENRALRVNVKYYIGRQVVPVLARIFDLVGMDVRRWPDELPRIDRAVQHFPSDDEEGDEKDAGVGVVVESLANSNAKKKQADGKHVVYGNARKLMQTTIDRFYQTRQCAICQHRQTAVNPGSAARQRDAVPSGKRSTLLCEKCLKRPKRSDLLDRVQEGQRLERRWSAVQQICGRCVHGCSSVPGEPLPIESCVSVECPLTFERAQLSWQLRSYRKRIRPFLLDI
jgi:DNA polymerase zeta